MPSTRRESRKSRAQAKSQAARKLRKLTYKQPPQPPRQRHEAENQCLMSVDSSPVSCQTCSAEFSDSCSPESLKCSKLPGLVRRDNADELEFNRKIAEARVYLHSEPLFSPLVCPNNSPSDFTMSLINASIPPLSEHYSPVAAISAASLQTVKPELEYAFGIGIAMTDHERLLLETLLPRCTESDGPETTTMPSPVMPLTEVLMQHTPEARDYVEETSRSYTGYTIGYDESDLDNEA